MYFFPSRFGLVMTFVCKRKKIHSSQQWNTTFKSILPKKKKKSPTETKNMVTFDALQLRVSTLSVFFQLLK